MALRFTREITDWDRLPVLMDMQTTCQLLKCADVTVVKQIKDGHFKANKLGRAWLVDRDSVREYFQKTFLEAKQ